MNCKDIRELLKSDYLDNEAGLRQEQDVKEHLDRCPECRAVEKKLRSQRLLFENAGRFQPPEQVWRNIREAIVNERMKEEDPVRPTLIERLRGLIWSQRPVFAVVRVMAMMIFAVVLAGGILRRQQLINQEINSDIISAYSFSSDNGELARDMGTSIEEYFL